MDRNQSGGLPQKALGHGAMTTAKQLYSLQELDLVLDRVLKDQANAEEELSSDPGVAQMETALQEETERLPEVLSRQKDQQIEVESQRERSTRLDEQLYGGGVTNPRDLESLEQEASSARGALEEHDTLLIELTLQLEELQSNIAALEKALTDGQTAWDVRREELQQDLARFNEESTAVSGQREALASTFDLVSLQRYESLRQSKGGLAVAKVARGLCQACRMALPTQQQQRVKSGRQMVYCSSCSRILYLS